MSPQGDTPQALGRCSLSFEGIFPKLFSILVVLPRGKFNLHRKKFNGKGNGSVRYYVLFWLRRLRLTLRGLPFEELERR